MSGSYYTQIYVHGCLYREEAASCGCSIVNSTKDFTVLNRHNHLSEYRARDDSDEKGKTPRTSRARRCPATLVLAG